MSYLCAQFVHGAVPSTWTIQGRCGSCEESSTSLLPPQRRQGSSMPGRVRSAIRVTAGSRIHRAVAPNCELRRLLLLVELEDAYRAVGRGVDAEVAEDALVAVLVDDLNRATGVLEDVDGADFLQLGGEGGIVADRVIDLD